MENSHEEHSDNNELEFPFQRNTPLEPQLVTDTLGDFGRQFRLNRNGASDFPQKVIVKLKNGREINTILTSIFTDGGSQRDGTFYFSENVRDGKKNHYFGSEIETLTFVD